MNLTKVIKIDCGPHGFCYVDVSVKDFCEANMHLGRSRLIDFEQLRNNTSEDLYLTIRAINRGSKK